MQIVQKKNRSGTYYLAKTDLCVNGKRYTIAQRRMDPKKAGPQWRLTSSQMISILRHTKDWLFSWVQYWEHAEHAGHNFRPADTGIIQSLIRDLEHIKPVFIYYNAQDKDMLGYKLDQGTFELNFPFYHFLSYRLKPSHDFVRIEI